MRVAVTFVIGVVCTTSAGSLEAQSITRVSVDSSGAQGNDHSRTPAISADGRFVAFFSEATNLVAGDTNSVYDIFLRDLQTGATTRVSVNSSGAQGNNQSVVSAISADGRFVAFFSHATNLVADDTNGAGDVFLRDLQTGATTRVSVDSSGAQGNSFGSPPTISADGRFVGFYSDANDLVAGDTNSVHDSFLRDLQTGATTRVSVDSSGAQGNDHSRTPAISADGRFVAFFSEATNLVAGDTNSVHDIFLRDLQTGATTRVSVDSSGAQGNNPSWAPAISADGRFVVFYSHATNLVAGDTNGVGDVFLRDLQTGATTRVSVDSSGAQGNSYNSLPAISADGRFVAFYSYATNLVAGDTNGVGDVFLRDLQTGATTRVSVDSWDEYDWAPAISADGRFVAFYSYATNLVAGDTNGVGDVFLRDLQTGATPTPLPKVINEAPEVLAVQKSEAAFDLVITMPHFKGIGSKLKKTILRKVVNSGGSKNAKLTLRYLVELATEDAPGFKVKSSESSRIGRRRSKRNEVTFENQPPGRYSARYRVEVLYRKQLYGQTSWSPRASVTAGG